MAEQNKPLVWETIRVKEIKEREADDKGKRWDLTADNGKVFKVRDPDLAAFAQPGVEVRIGYFESTYKSKTYFIAMKFGVPADSPPPPPTATAQPKPVTPPISSKNQDIARAVALKAAVEAQASGKVINMKALLEMATEFELWLGRQ